jgi:UDP-N-acetylglucosamine diphosphorylase / glucose-1-phosphate thymidylyltransferase / UDP-N-acetylgalactosamine diphosphorylase / glucosamine-1-phosphate N-acetyltransferase / galactosamine-1-phosphate N-acetyltransferase
MNREVYEKSRPVCVIVCGGKGTRLLPLSLEKQKTMIEIKNKPILRYIVEYWKKYTDDFIFIVNYKKEGIIEYLKTQKDINSKVYEEKELKGVANAIFCVEDMVTENFIVVLGDCICNGKLDFPEKMVQGIGVWKTKNKEDIKKSYSVKISEKFVSGVVEKPKEAPNDNCGTGFYFFNKVLFEYIPKTPKSHLTGKVEITEVIQRMIDSNEKISPVFLEGDYLNITALEDLEKAEKILTKNNQ